MATRGTGGRPNFVLSEDINKKGDAIYLIDLHMGFKLPDKATQDTLRTLLTGTAEQFMEAKVMIKKLRDPEVIPDTDEANVLLFDGWVAALYRLP